MIANEKGESDPFDLKLVAGGLLDVEFLAQYLTLRHAHERPEMLTTSTAQMIANAKRFGFLGSEEAAILGAAHRLYTDVTQILRLALPLGFCPSESNDVVKRRLAAAGGVPEFSQLERELEEIRGKVRATFNSILASYQGSH
jgi:glutamate-ammonia-ligase adenylyltransferase